MDISNMGREECLDNHTEVQRVIKTAQETLQEPNLNIAYKAGNKSSINTNETVFKKKKGNENLSSVQFNDHNIVAAGENQGIINNVSTIDKNNHIRVAAIFESDDGKSSLYFPSL